LPRSEARVRESVATAFCGARVIWWHAGQPFVHSSSQPPDFKMAVFCHACLRVARPGPRLRV